MTEPNTPTQIAELETELGRSSGTDQEVEILIELLSACRNTDERKAMDYGIRALSLIDDEKEPMRAASVLRQTALIAYKWGQLYAAFHYARKLLAISERIDDRPLRAEAHNILAAVHWQRGDGEDALNCLREALEIKKGLGDESGMAAILNNLAGICLDMGDHDRALDNFFKAKEIREKLGCSDFQMSRLLNNIGVTYSRQGDNSKALEFYDRSLELVDGSEEVGALIETLTNSCVSHCSLNAFEEALECCRRAQSLIRRTGKNIQHEMLIALASGDVYLRRGQLQLALENTRKGLGLAEEIGSRARIMHAYNLLGQIYDRLGYQEKASRYTSAADSILEDIRTRTKGKLSDIVIGGATKEGSNLTDAGD